ncbi:MAG TPA: GNAT family N-acetyltransferase [Gaiellaceae bacterium]|jgi:GNAT superfamily N-acetyltransferase
MESAVAVERLGADSAREHRDRLAAVLVDCVEGGASVSFMAPFSLDDARAYFASIEPEVAVGTRVLLAAFLDGDVVGTVQVTAAWPPNQPHRADVAKLLVRRSSRNRGIGRKLMERAEAEAREQGWTLLVLDTVTGDPAERLYEQMGWTKVGVIPGFALYPDGRPCDTTVFYKTLGEPAGGA